MRSPVLRPNGSGGFAQGLTALAGVFTPAESAYRNRFDHFVFRNDLATVTSWSTSSGWKQSGTNNNVSFTSEDAYANAILEFTVRNDSDYVSTNDMFRMTSQTFMLNQIRMTGDFSGLSHRSGTVNGNALLLVESLDGQLPRIQLDATSTNVATQFTFHLDNELQLLNDLEITGDGTQPFVIAGSIKDYYQTRNVIKSGSSSVTLAGVNTFGGTLVINEGRVTTSNLAGSVENNGGEFAAGAAPALTIVNGDFVQNSGTLEMQIGGDLAGTQYDRLVVNDSATLGGTLSVELVNGFTPNLGQKFDLIFAGNGLTDTFEALSLPVLQNGMWSPVYTATSLSLFVTLQGDFNGDRVVDAADYVVWRKGLGSIDEYNMWRSHFGQSIASGEGGNSSVPEPSGLLMTTICALLALSARRRHGACQ